MAYSAPSTRTTGTLITAAIWNADVVANPIALYAGAMSIASQAALDFIYASSATQFGRVAKGAGLQSVRLNSDATAYEFFTPSTLLTTSDAEASTTNSSATTLKTISGISVPITSTLIIVFATRKSSGADYMRGEIGFNGAAVAFNDTQYIPNTNAAGSGVIVCVVGPRTTSYTQGGFRIMGGWDGAAIEKTEVARAALPTGAITSIEIKARNTAGSITVAVAEVKVYEWVGV